jgi:phosphoglycolate phosphatase-like HAD superfamily hydrolase
MKNGKGVLLLFDIDGTLIHQVGRSGITSNRFSYAVNKVFNAHTTADMISAYGQVDTETLLALAEKSGVRRSKARKHLPRLYQLTVKYFKMHLKDYNTHPQAGVKTLLSKLRKQKYTVALVTGNLGKIAELKLKKVGLWGFFDFGVYGDISNERSTLIRRAIKVANERTGAKFTRYTALYFGDAPLDIKAAKKAGVKIIAVATGHYSEAVLKAAKPDYLLKDMSDHYKIFRIINKVC